MFQNYVIENCHLLAPLKRSIILQVLLQVHKRLIINVCARKQTHPFPLPLEHKKNTYTLANAHATCICTHINKRVKIIKAIIYTDHVRICRVLFPVKSVLLPIEFVLFPGESLWLFGNCEELFSLRTAIF